MLGKYFEDASLPTQENEGIGANYQGSLTVGCRGVGGVKRSLALHAVVTGISSKGIGVHRFTGRLDLSVDVFSSLREIYRWMLTLKLPISDC